MRKNNMKDDKSLKVKTTIWPSTYKMSVRNFWTLWMTCGLDSHEFFDGNHGHQYVSECSVEVASVQIEARLKIRKTWRRLRLFVARADDIQPKKIWHALACKKMVLSDKHGQQSSSQCLLGKTLRTVSKSNKEDKPKIRKTGRLEAFHFFLRGRLNWKQC